MIIEKLSCIDYEPLKIRLIAVRGSVLALKESDDHVRRWLSERETKPFCHYACHLKHVEVNEAKGRSINVAIQWACPDCVDALLASLDVRFKNIERVRIGDAEDEAFPKRVVPQRICFERRKVTFEDDRFEEVAAFEIVNNPVTVEEMKIFCEATGYVTSAERQQQDDT